MRFDEALNLGVEPTPNVIAARIVAVLEHTGRASREQLILDVERAWADAGHSPMPRSRTTSRVKKALNSLRQQGIAENFHTGHWRLVSEEGGDEPVTDTTEVGLQEGRVRVRDSLGSDAQVAPILVEAPPIDDAFEAEQVLGEGAQSVYAFYLPTFRRLAELQGSERWPVKIGMTTSAVSIRMASHVTALPEAPVVGVVFQTDNAGLLEKILHGILSIRDRHVDEGGGTEWFDTSPVELVELYKAILGDRDNSEALQLALPL